MNTTLSRGMNGAGGTKSRRAVIVGYLRTSTDDQLLGIDAQRETLERFASDRGCEIVRTFTEHESGANNDRPELDKAVNHARRVGAMLVVAKLDRLARDSGFLMELYDGSVPIAFGDLPEIDGSAASRLMVQMMANMAEFERRRTGEKNQSRVSGPQIPWCQTRHSSQSHASGAHPGFATSRNEPS